MLFTYSSIDIGVELVKLIGIGKTKSPPYEYKIMKYAKYANTINLTVIIRQRLSNGTLKSNSSQRNFKSQFLVDLEDTFCLCKYIRINIDAIFQFDSRTSGSSFCFFIRYLLPGRNVHNRRDDSKGEQY
ncbi:hypothetical protein Leryth_018240 [Lithospermum erythrorhizon]|nr:hypothetical protein Leryth_018240 [Lithospermum erythrorhizon]